MPREVALRHRLPQFNHLFTSDAYSAGYYSYLWSEVMDADTWQAFEAAGNVFDLSQKDMANRTAIYVDNDGKANPPLVRIKIVRTLIGFTLTSALRSSGRWGSSRSMTAPTPLEGLNRQHQAADPVDAAVQVGRHGGIVNPSLPGFEVTTLRVEHHRDRRGRQDHGQADHVQDEHEAEQGQEGRRAPARHRSPWP